VTESYNTSLSFASDDVDARTCDRVVVRVETDT
jgi:hypothetical protein